MARNRIGSVVQKYCQTVLRRDGIGLSDGQLLDGFLAGRNDAYFEALVRRHGPMVLGVCRRLLRNPQDVEDAFQATFLVLLRRGDSVSPRDAVGNWLYGVAHRTALEARRAVARRQAREIQVEHLPHPSVEATEQ
jgi:RNA polymerase sigma factor (sigma-70 family)